MKLKEFLEQNKIIMQSALSVLMWPDKKNQAKVFSNKINEVPTGKSQSKQRITEGDEERAKIVLLELADRIKSFAGEKKDTIKQDTKPIIKAKVQPKRFNLAEELEKLKNK